jgi:hypothetical protein
VGFTESLYLRLNQKHALLVGSIFFENSNFQLYNILSAYEVKNETSTSRTYISLVFYHMVRSKKILVKKELQVLFSEGGRFEWFCTKKLWTKKSPEINKPISVGHRDLRVSADLAGR